jgi:hypothetical protein
MITAQFAAARLRVFASTSSAWVRRDERGEGVISTAIAVLIMAFLGVAMWVGLSGIWDSAEANTSDQVEQIGQ